MGVMNVITPTATSIMFAIKFTGVTIYHLSPAVNRCAGLQRFQILVRKWLD